MHRILIVDDELMIRRGVSLGVDWQQMGCVVIAEAVNGAEGLRLALELKPDLIITDIRMPKMDGLEMLAELRKQGCDAKVIVLTAYDEFTFAQKALQLGAVDYLLKPFRDQDLAGTVMRILKQEPTACVPSPQSLLPDIPKGRRISTLRRRYTILSCTTAITISGLPPSQVTCV